jgi:hypothetical protein
LRRYSPRTTRASKAITTTAASRREYSPTISPGSTTRAGLLERLADGRLGDGLVDLEEAARLSPPALARLDAPAEEHDLAVGVDRDRRDDEPGIDVGDESAGRAGEPVAVLALDRPNVSASPHRVQ